MKEENTYRILTGLINGDSASFKWIYAEYHALIYYYSLKFIQIESLAEEATADVFIILWKKRALIDPKAPIQAFLYKIAKDTAYNYLKKIATDSRLKKQYLATYAQKESDDAESLLIGKEQLAHLDDMIETLPPKRLAVFKLRFYDGLDNGKIARELGISINTVKVHLAKARLFLRHLNL